MAERPSHYAHRARIQKEGRQPLPLPTTTIGSSPNAGHSVRARGHSAVVNSVPSIIWQRMRDEIALAVRKTGRVGTGCWCMAKERNDMVEYFAEYLVGLRLHRKRMGKAAVALRQANHYLWRTSSAPKLYHGGNHPRCPVVTDRPMKGMRRPGRHAAVVFCAR